MPIQRITQPSKGSGGKRAEPVVEYITLDGPQHLSLQERQEARLREAALNREAAGSYGKLQRGLTREPLTALEVEMGKSKEQRERETVNTSGASFDREQELLQEKLDQENAVTTHGSVTKMGQGHDTRIIPTAEVYAKEAGERSEGIPAGDPNPVALAGAGVAGQTKIDEAELKLGLGNSPTGTNARSATGAETEEDAIAIEGEADAPDGSVMSDEEVEKASKGSKEPAKEEPKPAAKQASKPAPKK